MRNVSLRSLLALLLVLGAAGPGGAVGCSDGGSSAHDEGTTGGETATQPIDDVTDAPAPPPDTAVASPSPSADPSCVGTTCVAGQHCEIVQVQCVRAPCPPLPQCVDD